MKAVYECRNCGTKATVTTSPGPNDADIVQPPVEGCKKCKRALSPRDRIE